MSLKPTLGHINPRCERASWWREIFGSLEVPLVSPVASTAEFPDGSGGYVRKRHYMVDMERVEPDRLRQVAAFLAKKFELEEQEVWDDMDAHGIPILADEVRVSFDARLVL